MGWYGDSRVKCPNCGQKKANEIYRNNMLESYYLACTGCGLHLYAPDRVWVVKNSYIDKSIIGKKPEDIDPDLIVDTEKNENIIKEGSVI